jgi:hypothetical protein
MPDLMLSKDIDDRLAIEYLRDDFNNVWHGETPAAGSYLLKPA